MENKVNVFLSTRLSTGKYKGKTVREVAKADPEYIEWCTQNMDNFVMSDKALNEIRTNNVQNAPNAPTELGLHDEMKQGVYAGHSIKKAIDSDATYVFWCIKYMKGFALNHTAKVYLKNAFIDQKDKPGYKYGRNAAKVYERMISRNKAEYSD